MTVTLRAWHHGRVITTATPVLGSGLGFNPFTAAAGLVKKSITVPTKLAIQVAKDKNVQHAAVQAGQQYAQQNYASQYAAGQKYAAILHPGAPGGPPAGMPMPPGEMGPPGDDGAPAGANPNSHMMLYGLIGVGVIAALLLTKK